MFDSVMPAHSVSKTRVNALMSRASTSCFISSRKTWMAGTSPAMTSRVIARAALGRRGRRRRVEIDENLAVAHLGLEGLERDEAGRFRRLAARHVKFTEVEGALDLLALERAVGEVGHAVCAARLGGVIGPIDVVDGNELVADLAADHAILGHIGSGTDLNSRHRLSGSHGKVGGYSCFTGMAEKCKGADRLTRFPGAL